MSAVTEPVAKTKVCAGPPQTINGKEPLLMCLGSLCMAWRWAEKPAGLGARRESPGYGFCGLAGRPE